MHPRSSKQLLTARVAASSPHMAGPHGRIAIYKPSRGRLKVTETCTILHWATAVIWGWPCWPMSKICGTPSVNHAFYVDGNSTHKFTTGWYEHPPVISWFLTIYIYIYMCVYMYTLSPPKKNDRFWFFNWLCVTMFFCLCLPSKTTFETLSISHFKDFGCSSVLSCDASCANTITFLDGICSVFDYYIVIPTRSFNSHI